MTSAGCSQLRLVEFGLVVDSVHALDHVEQGSNCRHLEGLAADRLVRSHVILGSHGSVGHGEHLTKSKSQAHSK